jgi:hypothetical protein
MGEYEMDLIQDWVQWQAFVSTVMNSSVSIMAKRELALL